MKIPAALALALFLAACSSSKEKGSSFEGYLLKLGTLQERFSDEATVRSRFDVADVRSAPAKRSSDGGPMTGVTIYPDDSTRSLSIYWHGSDGKGGLALVSISTPQSLWYFESGLTTGIGLDSLEAIKGGRFGIDGTGWERVGRDGDRNHGEVYASMFGGPWNQSPRFLFIGISPSISWNQIIDAVPDLPLDDLHSGMDDVRLLEPTVYEVAVRWERAGG